MLNGNSRTDVCSTCYKNEAAGFSSLRLGKNQQYQDQITNITAGMKNDGFVEPLIRSLDFRFSNLCNLKCRTCGPEFSSSWAKETGIDTVNPQNLSENAVDILKDQYQNIERIYFAGGEPLIMPEHFRTLNTLIDIGQAEKVTLFYNSNVSILHYKNNDLLKYWQHFKKVTVGASIDAVGDRASYIRHGAKWMHTFMEYKVKQSNFNFYYSPTISIFNADHISDMHKYLWENNLLPNINSIKFNVILNDEKYICSMLPKQIKDSIHAKIENTKNWLRSLDAEKSTILQYENLQLFLKNETAASRLKNFLELTKILDKTRREDFFTTFPEYSELIQYQGDQV